MSAALKTAMTAVGSALNNWRLVMDQESMSADYDRWRRAQTRANEVLRANLAFAGGTMVEGSEAKLRLCGITATSTHGLQMAARNWVASAGKRIDQGTVS